MPLYWQLLLLSLLLVLTLAKSDYSSMVKNLGNIINLRGVPSKCPNTCTGPYALCISATCDRHGHCSCFAFPTGESCSYYHNCSGIVSSPSSTPMEEAKKQLNDGAQSAINLRLHSTFSTHLMTTYNFSNYNCSHLPGNADCMDAPCQLDWIVVTHNATTNASTFSPRTVPLLNTKTGKVDQVATATCKCVLKPAGWGVFQRLNHGHDLNPKKECDVIRSTYGAHVN